MEDLKRDLKAINEFKKQMLRKLGDNTDKRHWLKMSYEYLLDRLKEETRELEELLINDKISYKHKALMNAKEVKVSELTAIEILENAKYNLEVNLPKMIPVVKEHPVYLMGIEQLINGLKKLREEDEE